MVISQWTRTTKAEINTAAGVGRAVPCIAVRCASVLSAR
jgi:hypothetical protein